MNNTNQQLYVIYKNVASFYRYRGLVSLDDELSQDQFIKNIQKDKFKLLSAIPRGEVVDEEDVVNEKKLDAAKKTIHAFNEKSDARNLRVTHILLVYPGTDCESKKAIMMNMINHIRFPSADVIVVTPTKISTGVLKGLQALPSMTEHQDQDFKAFTYTLLNAVLPEYELAPTYNILNSEQIDELRHWFIDPDALPKIFENDPQMVWIGAKIGDVIKFTSLCEVTIETIGYCKVVPPM